MALHKRRAPGTKVHPKPGFRVQWLAYPARFLRRGLAEGGNPPRIDGGQPGPGGADWPSVAALREEMGEMAGGIVGLPPEKDRISGFRGRLMRRAVRYTRSRDEAEDLAQEALLRVWARLRQDPPVEDVERYLFTTLRHLAGRRKGAEEELTEETLEGAPAPGTDRLAAAEVVDALRTLPGPQARLILEHALEGASYRELARRHGLPLGTVMSRVARGRAGLIKRLDLTRERPVADLLGRRG